MISIKGEELIKVKVSDSKAEYYSNVAKGYADSAKESAEAAKNYTENFENNAQEKIAAIENKAIETLNEFNNAKGAAKAWAIKMDGAVEDDLYSSKYYAQAAKNNKDEIDNAITNFNGQIAAVDTKLEQINTNGNKALSDISDAYNTGITTINAKIAAVNSAVESVQENKISVEAAKTEALRHSNNASNYAGSAQTCLENVNQLKEDVTGIKNDIISVKNNAESNIALNVELAQKYAQNPVDTEILEGKYSAMHWAKKAESFANSVGNPLDKDLSLITDAGIARINGLIDAKLGNIDTILNSIINPDMSGGNNEEDEDVPLG